MASLKYTVDVDTKGARSSISSLERSLGGLGAAVAGAFAVGEIVGFADELTSLQNKLRAFSGSQAEVNAKFEQIAQIAGRSRSELGAVGDLYNKMSIASAELGYNQEQVGIMTETFTKSLKVGGATAAQSASAILQFSQAMGSGVLRGEEFNAVFEASSSTMMDLAKQLGVPVGQMRKLAEEGKLTSKVVGEALLRMQEDVDERFAKTIPTISEGFTNLRTAAGIAFTEMAADAESPVAGLAGLGKSILELTTNIPKLVSAIKDLTNVLLLAGGAMLAFRAHTFLATGGFTVLQGAIATFGKNIGGATTGLLNFGKAGQSVKNGMVGLGTSLGIFDKSRGSIMKTAEGMGVVGTSIKRVSQFGLSLSTVFSGMLRIGLRLTGIGFVIMTIIDVINLLYKAVTGSNEKLIDFGSIFKGIVTVVRVVYGLLAVLGNYIGQKLAPYVQMAANAWNSFMSAIMDSGPIRAAASMLDYVGSRLSALWQTAKDISGVTAADKKAAEEKYLMNPVGGLLPYGPQDKKTDPPIKLGPGTTKASGKSAKDIAEEQAKALRDVKDAVLEVTKAFNESTTARLEDLKFQYASLGMSEDQVALESQKRDLIREQKDALKTLADEEKKVEEQFKNNELSNKGRKEAIALIREQEAAIKASSAANIVASEAELQKIQAKNLAFDEQLKKTGLLQKANENKATLQAIEDQLTLVGLYGDKLDEVTAQLELQQQLRANEVAFQNQLLELEDQKLKLGEKRFNMEKAILQQSKADADAAAKATAAAQKKVDDAQKKSERNDVGAALRKRFEELERSVDPAVTALQGLDSLFGNMTSALDNFVETGKLKFGDLAKSIIADLAKIALKATVTKLFTLVGKAILGGGAPGGNAAGGPVSAGKASIVGEQGPELFVPNSAGRILTNATLNRNAGLGESGMGATVNNTYITNNISAIDSRSVAQMFVENRKSLLGASMMARKETPYGG
jgi:lambda family phage tail tape measure protein